MPVTQLSAWRRAVAAEPQLPLRQLREVKFDLRCGCGTGFLKRTIKDFPTACSTCGGRPEKMTLKRSKK